MTRVLVVLGIAALAVAACKGNEGPVAGELSVRLGTPRGTDRAILFRVIGPRHAVTAATGYQLVVDTSAAGDTAWIAVIAPVGTGLKAGEIARLAVADTRKAGDYKSAISDVAAPNYTVGDTAGVSLTVVKP
jgi:hypothetical protein